MEEGQKPDTNETAAQAPAPVQTQTNAGQKSGSNGSKVIVIIIIVVAVLAIAGYAFSKFIARKVGEGIAEKTIETMTGGKVDVDADQDSISIKNNEGEISTGTKASWPSDMISSVPKFNYGKIASNTSSTYSGDKSWTITYIEVDADAATKYEADMIGKGWTKQDEINAGLVVNLNFVNSTHTLNLSIDSSARSALLTVMKKYTE